MISCAEDDIAPMLEELENEAYDLVVLNSSSDKITVRFKASGTDLTSITADIMAQGTTEVLGTNTLKNIQSASLNSVSLLLSFPANDVAPSGIYTVNYTMESKSGESSVGTYDINVINNVSPVYCQYTDALPSGKSVWVRLYVPEGASMPADDNTIYITGSFGTREGGSDWDGGGNADFAFNKIDDTCYELALNLQSGDEFKITRGDWGQQLATATGAEGSNIIYNGESTFPITVYNWTDLPTVTPETSESLTLNVPAEAVQSGMLTVVANVNNYDVADGSYYVVEKGATNLDNAFAMVTFDGENKLAAAVPKTEGVEYVIVRNEATAVGSNSYGFVQSTEWDGQTNPVQVNVGAFDGPAFTLGDKIVIVGAASPGDWGASSGQDFTKTGEGHYEIIIDLNADSEYLLLPDYGQWGDKWAYGSGDALSGTFDVQGSGSNLFTSGIEAGSYKIAVDFTSGNGSYQLSKQ